MAGVGVKLKRIYEKKSITANVFGVGYSILITIAPLLWRSTCCSARCLPAICRTPFLRSAMRT